MSIGEMEGFPAMTHARSVVSFRYKIPRAAFETL